MFQLSIAAQQKSLRLSGINPECLPISHASGVVLHSPAPCTIHKDSSGGGSHHLDAGLGCKVFKQAFHLDFCLTLGGTGLSCPQYLPLDGSSSAGPLHSASFWQESPRILVDNLKPKSESFGVPIVAQWLTNTTRNHEVSGSIPGLAQWVKDPALL